jgi:hypothetical protein
MSADVDADTTSDTSDHVPGHTIEFGVWKGDSIRVIRDELRRSAIWDGAQRKKRIYASDHHRSADRVRGRRRQRRLTDVLAHCWSAQPGRTSTSRSQSSSATAA